VVAEAEGIIETVACKSAEEWLEKYGSKD